MKKLPITGIPRRRLEHWNIWKENLSDADYDNLVQQINDFCDENPHFISSFIPKQIWGDEPCQPLLDACNQSVENAGFFFGLIVWMTLIKRDDKWMFNLAENDDDVLGTTYWKID